MYMHEEIQFNSWVASEEANLSAGECRYCAWYRDESGRTKQWVNKGYKKRTEESRV